MAVFQLAAFGLLAASIVVLVRAYRPEMALQISIVAGLLLLLYIIAQVSGILASLKAISERYGVNTLHRRAHKNYRHRVSGAIRRRDMQGRRRIGHGGQGGAWRPHYDTCGCAACGRYAAGYGGRAASG